jgi:hypothetical protein
MLHWIHWLISEARSSEAATPAYKIRMHRLRANHYPNLYHGNGSVLIKGALPFSLACGMIQPPKDYFIVTGLRETFTRDFTSKR